MDQDPSKRALTDHLHASNTASNFPSTAYTSPDLALALRNVGARARKNVTEGYATGRDFHPSTGFLPVRTNKSTEVPIFRSANDTLREVFSSTAPRPRSLSMVPSRKRGMAEAGIGAREITPEPDHHPIPVDRTEDPLINLNVRRNHDRPIKSLRKSYRPLGKTQSLPVDGFRFSGGSSSLQQSETASGLSPVTEKLSNVDDDDDEWSLAPTSTFEPMVL